ncbi:MAG: LysE family translocator [Gammaproteobacteria bacterium]|nr:LysE family translocator [Gammaproteobacteria bacterium]
MPDPAQLLLFFTSALLLGIAPGPDNLFVLSIALRQGVRAGVSVTLGLCSGLLLHTAAVALGVATLLLQSPLAFTLLKLSGAGYLLYLAHLAWREASSVNVAHGAAQRSAPSPIAISLRRLYRRGVLLNISNPKVTLFFLAFLPQFIDASASYSAALQTLILGALFIIATLLVFGSIAFIGGRGGARLNRSATVSRWLHRVTALLFLGLALRLLL